MLYLHPTQLPHLRDTHPDVEILPLPDGRPPDTVTRLTPLRLRGRNGGVVVVLLDPEGEVKPHRVWEAGANANGESPHPGASRDLGIARAAELVARARADALMRRDTTALVQADRRALEQTRIFLRAILLADMDPMVLQETAANLLSIWE